MSNLAAALQRTATLLEPHREALVEAWVAALREAWPEPEDDLRDYCAQAAESLFGRLVRGELDALLSAESRAAEDAARLGDSLQRSARAIRVLDGCCLPFLARVLPRSRVPGGMPSRPRRAGRSPSRSPPAGPGGRGGAAAHGGAGADGPGPGADPRAPPRERCARPSGETEPPAGRADRADRLRRAGYRGRAWSPTA